MWWFWKRKKDGRILATDLYPLRERKLRKGARYKKWMVKKKRKEERDLNLEGVT